MCHILAIIIRSLRVGIAEYLLRYMCISATVATVVAMCMLFPVS